MDYRIIKTGSRKISWPSCDLKPVIKLSTISNMQIMYAGCTGSQLSGLELLATL